MNKVGRNDPCPCGSGKKFKKCCEERMTHRKIQAEVLSSSSGLNQAQKLTSFFHRKVELKSVPNPAPAEPKAEETAGS